MSAAAGGCVSLRLATAKWSLTPCAAARVYVCQTLACRPGEFRCGTRCLPPSWVCDGEKDCPGGQDENDCGELPHRPTLSHDAFTQPRCSAPFFYENAVVLYLFFNACRVSAYFYADWHDFYASIEIATPRSYFNPTTANAKNTQTWSFALSFCNCRFTAPYVVNLLFAYVHVCTVVYIHISGG